MLSNKHYIQHQTNANSGNHNKNEICHQHSAPLFANFPSTYALYSKSKKPVARSTTTLLFGNDPATPYSADVSPIALP